MVVESQGLQTKAKGSSFSVLFNDLFPNADSIGHSLFIHHQQGCMVTPLSLRSCPNLSSRNSLLPNGRIETAPLYNMLLTFGYHTLQHQDFFQTYLRVGS